MKANAGIIGFFVAGIVLGRLHAVPATADLDAISLGVLCALIFFVGYGIGNDTTMLARFRSLSPGLALLPAVSILGSLAGSLAVAMLAGGHSPAEWLAVGSGMGYYSISSVLITGYRGTELGTIALLSNIVREMIALLGAPLLVRLFGTLAPIAAAGATAMDTTLPVISRTCGPCRYTAAWPPTSACRSSSRSSARCEPTASATAHQAMTGITGTGQTPRRLSP